MSEDLSRTLIQDIVAQAIKETGHFSFIDARLKAIPLRAQELWDKRPSDIRGNKEFDMMVRSLHPKIMEKIKEFSADNNWHGMATAILIMIEPYLKWEDSEIRLNDEHVKCELKYVPLTESKDGGSK